MHARSACLAQWLTENARDPTRKLPTPWHRALHPKDAAGRLLTDGLPYIEGVCVTPTRHRELNPDHAPPKKHMRPNPMHEPTTIDAFEKDTLEQLQQTRDYVNTRFAEMQEFW